MLHHLLPATVLGALCAPVFAQAPALRAPLQAWLTNQKSASSYEDQFVPFRKALLQAKSTKCSLVPNGGTDSLLYDLVPAITPLDRGMESFAAEQADGLPANGAANLLNLAAAFRANGDSLEPLLPWLLLLQRRGAPDPRVELCLFEAWGTDALDCAAGKAAAERLKSLDEAPLRAFLPEAKAFPAGKSGTAQRLVNQLCADRLDKGAPLGAFALRRALVAEIEKDFEVAMQFGDFPKVASSLQTMLLVDPQDWSAQLMLEASGAPTKGTRFADRYREATPEERAAIDARLQHLGLAIVAPGSSVAAVAQAVREGPLDFFRNDLGDRTKKVDAAIKLSEKNLAAKVEKVKDLRDDIVELERKVKKYSRTVGERSLARDLQQKADDKKVEADKLDAELAKDRDAKARIEAERQGILDQIEAVKKRRSAFRLQPADGTAPIEPEPEEPGAAAPKAPEPPARQPAPAPPMQGDFDAALPQARELRDATAELDLGRFERARTAFEAVKVELAKAPADATVRRMIAVTNYRLGESLQRLAKQKAAETRNDAEAERLFRAADAEFARVTGEDFGTAREGSSLYAAALRARLQVNSTLYGGYRDLAATHPTAQVYRQKRDALRTTANRLFEELKDSFATATLPDGRRIVDVAREEAAALAR